MSIMLKCFVLAVFVGVADGTSRTLDPTATGASFIVAAMASGEASNDDDTVGANIGSTALIPGVLDIESAAAGRVIKITSGIDLGADTSGADQEVLIKFNGVIPTSTTGVGGGYFIDAAADAANGDWNKLTSGNAVGDYSATTNIYTLLWTGSSNDITPVSELADIDDPVVLVLAPAVANGWFVQCGAAAWYYLDTETVTTAHTFASATGLVLDNCSCQLDSARTNDVLTVGTGGVFPATFTLGLDSDALMCIGYFTVLFACSDDASATVFAVNSSASPADNSFGTAATGCVSSFISQAVKGTDDASTVFDTADPTTINGGYYAATTYDLTTLQQTALDAAVSVAITVPTTSSCTCGTSGWVAMFAAEATLAAHPTSATYDKSTQSKSLQWVKVTEAPTAAADSAVLAFSVNWLLIAAAALKL